MADRLFFRALGPLEVTDAAGGALDLGGHRQRAVLALLLINANHVVSVDRLVDQLWGENPPRSVIPSLQAYISHLRRVLEPERPPRARPIILISRAPGYSLEVDRSCCDVTRYEDLLERSRVVRAEHPRRALDLLREAMRLWRGSAYEQFSYEGFAAMEIARLSELRLAALEERFEIELDLGRDVELIPELETLVAEHPLRERLRARLMLALYRSGRSSEALAVFQDLRKTLAEELGLDPSRELQHLESAILRQAPSLEGDRSGSAGAASAETGVQPLRLSAVGHDDRAKRPVGRDAELARFEHVVTEAARGKGRAVLIEGEPGIGKSRLVEAVLESASSEGAIALTGRCFEGGGAAPFWPWIQVLRALFDDLGMEPIVAAVGHNRGDLAHVLPELVAPTPLPSSDVDAGRFRAGVAIATVLTSLAEHGPVVVALDDLHCADVDSLRALVLLAQRIADTGVVLIGTYRGGEVPPGHAFADALAQLARISVVDRVSLPRLGRRDVAAVIETATGSTPSAAVTEAVYERSSGNPFFIVELARLLDVSGAIAEEQAALARVAIPIGVGDVLRQRLALLSPAAQHLVAVAAVVGRDFDVDVVAEVSELPLDTALALVDEVFCSGLIVDGHRPGQLRFSHVLVAETVVDGLSALRRAWLHRRVAEALERHHGDDPLRYSEIAHHTLVAAPAPEAVWAVPLLRRAAQLAAAALAFGEAERLHGAQLDLVRSLPASPERVRAELEALIDLSVILTWTRGYHAPEVGATVGRALELANAGGAAISIAAALYARWSHHCLRAEFDAADRVVSELATLAQEHPEPTVAFVAGLAQAVGAWGRGRIHDALRGFVALEPHLAEVTDPGLSRVVLVAPPVIFGSFYALCRTLAGDVEHGRRLCEETVRYARSVEHEWSLSYALVFGQAINAAMSADVPVAAAAAEEGIRRAEKHRFASLMPLAKVVSGWAEGVADRSVKALERAETAANDLNAAGAPALRHFLLGLLADGRMATGDPAWALRLAEEAIAEATRVGERF